MNCKIIPFRKKPEKDINKEPRINPKLIFTGEESHEMLSELFNNPDLLNCSGNNPEKEE